MVHEDYICQIYAKLIEWGNIRRHNAHFFLSHSENRYNYVLIEMSRSPCSVEEILTICHVSRPLIGPIVGVVSWVQSALYTYLLSHNKTNNTCCYGTSQFVSRTIGKRSFWLVLEAFQCWLCGLHSATLVSTSPITADKVAHGAPLFYL